LKIAWTIDTHSHADYVTGSPGLVARLGAVFVAPAASNLETPHRSVVDGDVVELADEMPCDSRSSEVLAHPALLVVERSAGVVRDQVGDLPADQGDLALDGHLGGVRAPVGSVRSELECALDSDRGALGFDDERSGAPAGAVGSGPDIGLGDELLR
jgi:hypothetical protein